MQNITYLLIIILFNSCTPKLSLYFNSFNSKYNRAPFLANSSIFKILNKDNFNIDNYSDNAAQFKLLTDYFIVVSTFFERLALIQEEQVNRKIKNNTDAEQQLNRKYFHPIDFQIFENNNSRLNEEKYHNNLTQVENRIISLDSKIILPLFEKFKNTNEFKSAIKRISSGMKRILPEKEKEQIDEKFISLFITPVTSNEDIVSFLLLTGFFFVLQEISYSNKYL